jgi:two-component system, NtrC family, nitrogen regulation sensor histidine kinase NtrY
MSFRAKLVLFFTLTVVAAVTLVAWSVSTYTRRAFEAADQKHTDAVISQFEQEFQERGEEVVNRVTGIAESEGTLKMAIDLSRPGGDASKYVYDATGLAASHHLDFLDIAGDDGSIISSSEWPTHFGYKLDWVATPGVDWDQTGAFLERTELSNGTDLSLTAVHVVAVGEKRFFIIGGIVLGKELLATLALPDGMRALFYTNLQSDFDAGQLTDVKGPAASADRLAGLINEVRTSGAPAEETIQWNSDPASAEYLHAEPRLDRDHHVLAVLLVGSSRAEMVSLVNFIRSLAVLVAGGGILLGLLLSVWISARVTRPINRLAAGAKKVAAGDWGARIEAKSNDEIGQLTRAFNEMTRQLAEQRDRLVQAERVAAWREIARRLAHELKNPLFPLQLTLENLQRAREQTPDEFDEVFNESTATLRTELDNLKTIVGRFSDFSKMPAPQLQSINLNDAVRNAVRLYDAQFHVIGRPPITPELYLDESLPPIQADPDLLHRALSNLVLNSLDAMAGGGTLTIRTTQQNGMAHVSVTDTGTGLTPEECARLFTPYYTTKRHGTGLGLAIVQSVVSDHHGKISVESAPGSGTTFRIDLPIRPAGSEPEHAPKPDATRTANRDSSSGGNVTKAKTEISIPANEEEPPQEKPKPRRELVGTKSMLGLDE